MKKRLYECAKMLRSKNSGPLEITLDYLLGDEQVYRKIKESGIIDRMLVAELYHVPEDLITDIMFFDSTLGSKITFARRIPSGASSDRGVYGMQQHTPLMELPVEIQELAYLLRLSRK